MAVITETEKLKKIVTDLGLHKESTMSDVVDAAVERKISYDEAKKSLDGIKDFFKDYGDVGNSFEGTIGNVKLTGVAATYVDPLALKNKLSKLNRKEEFISLVGVKIKDTRDKLGTTIFNSIADIVPNASITVKIKKT